MSDSIEFLFNALMDRDCLSQEFKAAQRELFELQGSPDESKAQETKALNFLILGNKLASEVNDAQGAILAYRLCIELHGHVSRVTLENTAPDAYYNLGVILSQIGNFEGAVGAYREALSLGYTELNDAYYNMGIALERSGDIRQAIVAYNQAITLDPQYADAYFNLGNVLAIQGETDLAIESYETYVSLYDGSSEWTKKARERIRNLRTSG